MSELENTIDRAFLIVNQKTEMLLSYELKEGNTKIDVFVDLGDGEKRQLLHSGLTRTLSNATRCQAVLDACLITAKKMRAEMGITTPAMCPEAMESGLAFLATLNGSVSEEAAGVSSA